MCLFFKGRAASGVRLLRRLWCAHYLWLGVAGECGVGTATPCFRHHHHHHPPAPVRGDVVLVRG